MSDGIKNQIGPFLHADGAVRTRTVGKTTYKVGIAGAYNAFGLIGPEHNGLFGLNDTNKTVVLDRHAEELSGYHGPSKAQWAELEAWMTCSGQSFLARVAANPRNRNA